MRSTWFAMVLPLAAACASGTTETTGPVTQQGRTDGGAAAGDSGGSASGKDSGGGGGSALPGDCAKVYGEGGCCYDTAEKLPAGATRDQATAACKSAEDLIKKQLESGTSKGQIEQACTSAKAACM